MTTKHYQIPKITEIKLHGDFRYEIPNARATAVKLTSMKHDLRIPVIHCTQPELWKEHTGFEHADDIFIRSWLIIFRQGLTFDTKVLDSYKDSEECRQAHEANETYPNYTMSYEYDMISERFFVEADNAHYEFDIPDEMLILLPFDLLDSWFALLPEAIQSELVNSMAWTYLMSTLPITNIRIVED